jgi:peptide/nickel transport system substrate-binding protein
MIRWLLADPESLNPLTANDAASSEVQGAIVTTLLTVDPKTLELVPFVAADLPEISSDHLRYRFRLRDDVTFSDGRPLTVEDVLFSMKATKNPEVNAPALRNYYLSVVDARAIDSRTVEFRCREPYFRNAAVLGSLPILPKHFYDPGGLLDDLTVAELADWDRLESAKRERARRFAEAFNVDFHRRILGAGAYVLRDPERNLITGERIVLDHRDDYWAPGDSLRGDGWVDRFFFRIINNQDAALVALKAGTLDLMTLTPLQHLKQTNTPGFQSRFEKVESYGPSFHYIGWNERRPMFADRTVRRALAHLVDRDRIIEKVLYGFGEKVDSPVYRFRPEYNTELRGYEFDPERAQRLLDEAGWVDSDGDGVREKTIDGAKVPFRFELLVNAGNAIRRNIGLIVLEEFRRAGIDARLREVDWSILLQRIDRFDYDAVILGWVMSVQEPDLYQIWHSSQSVPGGSNYVSFRNAEVDRILEEYRREFDEQRRIALYWRLQEILHDEAPYAFLYMPKTIAAYDRRFRDTTWYATGGPNLFEWWVPRPLQRYGG